MVGFIIGVFVGATFGVFTMMLCFAARDADDREIK